MKKICAATAISLVLCCLTARAEQTVAPDVRTAVKVSNHDINRFVCPGPMQDMIYSKEKRLTGRFSKSSAFIKFTIKKIGNKLEYATRESELYLVCDGNVYNIIAQPSNVASRTIRLIPSAGDSYKKNIALFKNMPLEKQALNIIREAYKETYPSSYKVSPAQQNVAIKPDLDVKLTQYVDVEGVGLRLKKYEIKSIARVNIAVTETDFLRSTISDSLLAVAVENHTLRPHETTRVFVVEKREAMQ